MKTEHPDLCPVSRNSRHLRQVPSTNSRGRKIGKKKNRINSEEIEIIKGKEETFVKKYN